MEMVTKFNEVFFNIIAEFGVAGTMAIFTIVCVLAYVALAAVWQKLSPRPR